MPETCPRCSSDKIIPSVPFLDHYGDVGNYAQNAKVKVHGKPDAWFFKDGARGDITLRICGECGHAEMQVSNFRELYKRYQKSQQA